MSPPHSATKSPRNSAKASTPKSAKGDKSKGTPRQTLSELSQNTDHNEDEDRMSNSYGQIDTEYTFRFTPELYKKLEKDRFDFKKYIIDNINTAISYIELVGWSQNGQIPASFYDSLFTPDFNVKRVILRGRGLWNSCRCPKKTNKSGELIDTIADRGITNLEHIIVARTFRISSCALLDLISRSPNLKIFRFYGSLELDDHHEIFQSVRFLSEIEGIYWPWCNVRHHKPTLRTLLKRQDQIETFYSSSDVTCDFLNADLLRQVKYLSLNMNEKWICEPGKTKILKRYNRNISALKKASNIEALELRTYDVNSAISEDVENSDTHDLVRRNYETYKLQFWESISELTSLKYISIHGGWELEEVCRELSKRGMQVEYLRTSLMPNSILTNVEGSEDNSNTNMVLSMSDAAKHISKLAKLKSLHFTCHDVLSNIDKQTASALRELSDLIWKIEIKCAFTSEVEELLTNILRRGNQNGRSYRIRMVINLDESRPDHAHVFAESIEKFSSTTSLKESLHEVASQKMRERFGRSNFKSLIIYGIEQAGGGRDKASFDQLRTTWTLYDNIFKPLDMFM
jgi:hypothetical protein